MNNEYDEVELKNKRKITGKVGKATNVKFKGDHERDREMHSRKPNPKIPHWLRKMEED